MPWKAFKVEDEWCVYRIDTDGDKFGKTLGCHGTRTAANGQIAALNIAEDKEKKMTDEVVEYKVAGVDTGDNAEKDADEKCYPEEAYAVPPVLGAKNFDELEDAVDANAMAFEAEDAAFSMPGMVQNIFGDPLEEDKPGALQVMLDSAKRKFGDIFSGSDDKEKEADAKPAFMVLKDKDTGEPFWIARYSNNLRDNDSPPEIISAASHRRFAKMVEDGDAEYPDLQLWHEPSLTIGKATWVAWDEEGVALAAGVFYKGIDELVDALEKAEDLGVSHGMPKQHLKYSEGDPTVIAEHVTHEISPLPLWAAANRWTSFVVLEDKSMAIEEEKKLQVIDYFGLDGNVLEQIEARNAELMGKAHELGIESKEADTEPAEPVEEEAEEVMEATPEDTEPEPETPSDAPETEDADDPLKQSPTRGEVLEALEAQQKALVGAVEQVMTEVMERMGSLERTDSEKIAEKIAAAPKATTLAEIMAHRASESAETKVADGEGGKLPKETDPDNIGEIGMLKAFRAGNAPEYLAGLLQKGSGKE